MTRPNAVRRNRHFGGRQDLGDSRWHICRLGTGLVAQGKIRGQFRSVVPTTSVQLTPARAAHQAAATGHLSTFGPACDKTHRLWHRGRKAELCPQGGRSEGYQRRLYWQASRSCAANIRVRELPRLLSRSQHGGPPGGKCLQVHGVRQLATQKARKERFEHWGTKSYPGLNHTGQLSRVFRTSRNLHWLCPRGEAEPQRRRLRRHV